MGSHIQTAWTYFPARKVESSIYSPELPTIGIVSGVRFGDVVRRSNTSSCRKASRIAVRAELACEVRFERDGAAQYCNATSDVSSVNFSYLISPPRELSHRGSVSCGARGSCYGASHDESRPPNSGNSHCTRITLTPGNGKRRKVASPKGRVNRSGAKSGPPIWSWRGHAASLDRRLVGGA
jgi:hypothetical protein